MVPPAAVACSGSSNLLVQRASSSHHGCRFLFPGSGPSRRPLGLPNDDSTALSSRCLPCLPPPASAGTLFGQVRPPMDQAAPALGPEPRCRVVMYRRSRIV